MVLKFYAVKKGYATGIFKTWDECKKQVFGYPGALYKSFRNREEAEAWLTGKKTHANPYLPDILKEDEMIAYVDGSYKDNCYAYGVILITANETIEHARGFCHKENAKLRNVSGELEGARYAMQIALRQNIKHLYIAHDYVGIAFWADGSWKANLPFTQSYQKYCQEVQNNLQLSFVKIKSHSGNFYNDCADRLAKQALEKILEKE